MSEAQLLSSRHIFKGKVVDLSIDEVRLPNGNDCTIEMVRHPGAAAVVPVDSDGRVLLVRQYRWATGGYLLEVPAGKLDHGEQPDVCARREVEEEIGRRAGTLVSLGWIWATPGFCDEKLWLYLATELTATRQELEPDEVLSVETMPLAEAVAMAEDGRIADAKSVCSLLRAACHFKR